MALKWGIFAKKKTSQQSLFCSFCGKDSASVKALIAGPAVFICNECVAVCNQCLGGGPVPVQSNYSICSDGRRRLPIALATCSIATSTHCASAM